jgi:sugar phosphate isomerase/epimerase
MNHPKLACPNLYPDILNLKSFALDNGFDGIDWTLRLEDLPRNHSEEARFASTISRLAPLEIRFHLFFSDNELGDADEEKAETARNAFCAAFDLISKLSGRYATIHVGLGRESMEDVYWERTIDGLANLRALALTSGIRLCLENLAWGWTSRPDLYEKLIRKARCWGTLDIGHAQVCPSVASKVYDVHDFASPHPARILGAHIYHEEGANGHVPPGQQSDLDERLRLLQELPLCDWWVLELRDEESLLQTLDCVNGFLKAHAVREAV